MRTKASSHRRLEKLHISSPPPATRREIQTQQQHSARARESRTRASGSSLITRRLRAFKAAASDHNRSVVPGQKWAQAENDSSDLAHRGIKFGGGSLSILGASWAFSPPPRSRRLAFNSRLHAVLFQVALSLCVGAQASDFHLHTTTTTSKEGTTRAPSSLWSDCISGISGNCHPFYAVDIHY